MTRPSWARVTFLYTLPHQNRAGVFTPFPRIRTARSYQDKVSVPNDMDDKSLTTVSIIPNPERLDDPVISFGPAKVKGDPITGYYRILNDHEDDHYREKGFTAGELVYVYVGKEAIHVFIADSEWKYKWDNAEHMEEFEKDFEFVPDGARIRQEQIANLTNEINAIDFSLGDTKVALAGFHPHIGEGGNLEGSNTLVQVGTSMTEAKLAVATVRNSVMKTKKELMAKTKKLALLAGEQAKALAIKVKEIEAMAAAANEAIWTINLYLGKEEQISVLRKGKPAPVGEKIAIRQSVLYMDEECGLRPREGGIDIRLVDMFDEWLLADPKNLNQILYHSKGIVALHIRSQAAKYEDPWMQAEYNEANLHWTYFLIRNGENLYRIYVDLKVGDTLLPTTAEFDELFWEDNGEERVPLKPGSDKWIKAMDASDARRKHYMRVVLVLQGLMDRTSIFKPMPTEYINLCDPAHCEEWFTIIKDAEKHTIITDGRPTFSDWRYDVNQGLEVGHRIIGIFDYSSGVRGSSSRDRYGSDNSRIYPANADSPDSMILHTVEEREGDHYIFRYKRTGEKVYSRDWRKPSGHEPMVRARCWVEKDDEFFLDFDSVTIEDLRYYQGHHLSKADYKNMVPLLEVAIALKEKEQKDEAPFKLLLIGQAMQRFGVSAEEAETQIGVLIKWWKFKNRTHRALLSDDKKAIEMILEEYGLRRKQTQIRSQVETVKDTLIRVIGGQTPEPVMIAHKKDNQYVAYVPHNNENIWVREQLWSYNRQTGDVKLKDEKQWRLVDKRFERWEILHKTDRWAAWRINPPMASVLTDPEVEALIQEALERKKIVPTETPEAERPPLFEWGESEQGVKRFVPMVVVRNGEFEIAMWYSNFGPTLPTECIINTRSEAPKVERLKLKWTRTKDGVQLNKYLQSDNYSYTPGDGHRPWQRKYYGEMEGSWVIRSWDDNITQVEKEFDLYHEHRKKKSAMQYRYGHVPGDVAKVGYNLKLLKARQEFDAEHGDPELWEDHLKELAIGHETPSLLGDALDLLVERGIEPEGMLLKEVYDRAAEFGLFKDEGYYTRKPKCMPGNLPEAYRVPAPRPPKAEADDSDDDD